MHNYHYQTMLDTDVLLYPCLQDYKGGNYSSQFCCLLELLQYKTNITLSDCSYYTSTVTIVSPFYQYYFRLNELNLEDHAASQLSLTHAAVRSTIRVNGA